MLREKKKKQKNKKQGNQSFPELSQLHPLLHSSIVDLSLLNSKNKEVNF
jgi:hypothetical protein